MTTAVDCALPTLVGARLRVPLVTGGDAPYANLDLAASAPALEDVAAHVTQLLPYYSSVHRGAGYASQVCTGVLEAARDTVGAFLGARPDDVVVFGRNTTDALNLLAAAVPGEVVCLDVEHHANLLPWRSRRVVPARATVAATLTALAAALRARPAALVAVTGASNVTGEVLPIAEVVEIAHAAGARVVLDAAQLAPHHPVDVAALDVDWVAFSGHKLYAPFGSGVLAGRADWLRDAEPYLAGGGASRKVARRADGGVDVEWHTTAARHEAGSPNVIGVYAVAAACKALTEAGFDRLVSREQQLLARLREGLAEVPEVRVLSLFGEDAPRVGVLSFVVQGWNSSHFAAALSAEYGIGVRDGLFCAHPLVCTLLGGEPDAPGECGAPEAVPGERSLNAIRVSFGAGTPDEHIERFVRAVRELVRDGARWKYRTEDGRCVPDRG